MSLTSLFTEIADAIREKNGSTEGIPASEFPEKIREISSGTGEVLYNIPAVTEWFAVSYKPVSYFYTPRVAYGQGIWIIIDTSTTRNTILRSEDGFSWEEVQLPGSKTTWDSIAFGAGRFIATDNYDIICSTDGGLTWTELTKPEEISYSRLIWFYDRFVLFKSDSQIYFYSFDGTNWVKGSLPEKCPNFSFCRAFDKFFILTNSGTNVYFSSDFATWGKYSIGQNGSAQILYGNGKIIIVFSDTNFIYESTNGTAWVKKSITTPNNMFSNIGVSFFAFGNFIVIGKSSNLLYYSTDGIIWSRLRTPCEGAPVLRGYALSDSIAIVPLDSYPYYLVTFNGTILK